MIIGLVMFGCRCAIGIKLNFWPVAAGNLKDGGDVTVQDFYDYAQKGTMALWAFSIE